MIRKVIIVFLTLATLSTVVFWILPFANYSVWLNTSRDGFNVIFSLAGKSYTIPRFTYPSHPIVHAVVITGDVDLLTLSYHHPVDRAMSDKTILRLDGFRLRLDYKGPDNVTREQVIGTLDLPLWFVFLLFATYPAIAFIRGPLPRWRRRRKGLCLKCGYNLTGNVSGVCPECGTKLEGP